MRRYLIPVFTILFLTMVGCGSDTPEPPSSIPQESVNGREWVVSFIIQEDGKSYRCFHSIDYRGGLWCTERESL